jgi:hypothetical protein
MESVHATCILLTHAPHYVNFDPLSALCRERFGESLLRKCLTGNTCRDL